MEQHSHVGADALVPLSPAHLTDDQGGTPTTLDIDPGDVRLFPARTAHRLKNIGSEPVQLLEFERK